MTNHYHIIAVNTFIYTSGTSATTGYFSTAKMIENGGLIDGNAKTVSTNTAPANQLRLNDSTDAYGKTGVVLMQSVDVNSGSWIASTGAINLVNNALAGILTCGDDLFNVTSIEFPKNCNAFHSSISTERCYWCWAGPTWLAAPILINKVDLPSPSGKNLPIKQ